MMFPGCSTTNWYGSKPGRLSARLTMTPPPPVPGCIGRALMKASSVRLCVSVTRGPSGIVTRELMSLNSSDRVLESSAEPGTWAR